MTELDADVNEIVKERAESWAAQQGVEFYRHREARWFLHSRIADLAESARARVNPLNRIGRVATTGSLDGSQYAKRLRHPQFLDGRVRRWVTTPTVRELPDGSKGKLRVVGGLDVTSKRTVNERIALHSILADGSVQSLGVVSNRFDPEGVIEPVTKIEKVGQMVEPSVYGWNIHWPDYFCDMNVVDPDAIRGRAVAPDSEEATFLLTTATEVIDGLNK